MRRHLAAQHDAAAQCDHGGDLAQRKVRIAPVMAAIDDLDADRTGVDVFLAGPDRHAGMPGALGFRHALHDAAVFQHDVMRGNVGAGGAQLRDRAFDVRHAGVVQQDHVGQPALVPIAVIRRRDDVGSDRGIRGKGLHVRVCPGERDGATPRINTVGCERTGRHRTDQSGQENGNVSLRGDLVYYSFTMSAAQSASGLAASHFGRVCAGASLDVAQSWSIGAQGAGRALLAGHEIPPNPSTLS